MQQVKSILDVNDMRAQRDTEGLIKILETTNSPHIKERAVAALGYLRDERAVPALIKAKENEGIDFQVRVIRSLGKISGPVAAKHLEELSLKGENPSIQGAADEALETAKKGMKKEFRAQMIRQTPTGREQTEARWRFESKEVKVTQDDIFYIGYLKDFEGLARLLKYKDPKVRADTVTVISQTHEPAFMEPLINTLNDEDRDVRCRTAAALRGFKDSRVVEALINVASNKKEYGDVRLEAISSLREIGDRKAVEPLTKILDDEKESGEIKAGTAYCLGTLKDDRAVPALIKTTYHEERGVKNAAVGALGETSSVDALNHLVKLRTEFKDDESLLANVNDAIEKLEKKLDEKKPKGQLGLDTFLTRG